MTPPPQPQRNAARRWMICYSRTRASLCRSLARSSRVCLRSSAPWNVFLHIRFHHLLKTFWCGWRDRQLPDGTVIWTYPTGHTYTTYPGSKSLFPTLCMPTGELILPEPAPDNSGDRGVIMPKRRRTRAENQARAIAVERRLNDGLVSERNRPPPL